MSNVMDVGGKRFVALRSAIEEMGGKVQWDNQSKQATIELNGKVTEVTMSDATASFGGKELELSAAPMVHDGTLFVPDDFFPMILQAQLPF
jgi:N-acetylmuramoyl-L-alanine amidase